MAESVNRALSLASYHRSDRTLHALPTIYCGSAVRSMANCARTHDPPHMRVTPTARWQDNNVAVETCCAESCCMKRTICH